MKVPLSRVLSYKPLIPLLFFAACTDEVVAPRAKPISAKPLATWVSPQPCQIGFVSPPNPPNYETPYFGTIVPTPGTTCGVSWSLNFPYSNYYGGHYGPKYAIGWTRDVGDGPGSFATFFMVGGSWWDYGEEGNEYQSGPLEIAFSGKVKNFSIVLSKDHSNLTGPLQAGHYMVAYDSVGIEVGRANFDAGGLTSEKTIAVDGIRKVVVYPVKIGFYDLYQIDQVETVHHRASFDVDPPGELKCTPAAPTRGQTVTCIVTGTGVLASGWNFTGPAFDSTGAALNIKGPTSGNSWSGVAVTSGVVSARISVNGVPRADSLRGGFIVTNRTGSTWHWQKDVNWTYGEGLAKQDCHKELFLYHAPAILGWNVSKGLCESSPVRPLPSSGSGYTLQPVTSGPNTGLNFVKTVTYRMDTQSNVLAAIKSGSSTRWSLVDSAQKRSCSSKNVSTTVNFYDFNLKCMNAFDLPSFIPGLFFHEGRGKIDNSGHQAQLELTASMPKNDLYRVVEAVYGLGKAKTDSAVMFEANRVAVEITAAFVSHEFVHDNWCGNLWLWDPPTKFFVLSPVRQTGGICI